MGQQWAALGTGPLAAAILGGAGIVMFLEGETGAGSLLSSCGLYKQSISGQFMTERRVRLGQLQSRDP